MTSPATDLSSAATAAFSSMRSGAAAIPLTAAFQTDSTNGSIVPSAMDLLMVIPRIAYKAGAFAFSTVPEHIDGLINNRYGRSIIAEATGEGFNNAAAMASGAAAPVAGGSATGAAITGDPGQFASFNTSIGLNNIRGLGGIFSYLTSKWALTCFTMAIILNRTQVYASARRHVHFQWPMRLALRSIPILSLIYQTLWLLEAIRCQSSPDYSLYRYNDPAKHVDKDFAGSGGTLYRLSGSILFWQNDADSCRASGMVPPTFDTANAVSGLIRGSSSLLWPLFKALCLSQFIETLICAMQGRRVMAETGMTLFEHSLAFAEAESMVSNHLNFGGLGSPDSMPDATSEGGQHLASAVTALTRSGIIDQVNTPPEVLLIGVISSLSHLTSQVLGVMGLQGRFRLLSTGFWGLCFMTAFLWSLITFNPGPSGDYGILRFPTVCIVGFIPHMLILAGIGVCAGIYLLAVLVSTIAPPEGGELPGTFKERFLIAQQNLQANIQLSAIRINYHEDFYSALLKIGFTVLTAASEAVFLKEKHPIAVRRWTWLEEARIKEIESARTTQRANRFSQSQSSSQEYTVLPSDYEYGEVDGDGSSDQQRQRISGYSVERNTEGLDKMNKGGLHRGDGVGAAERNGRWVMAWQLLRGIWWLIIGWYALMITNILETCHINYRPAWLLRLIHRRNNTSSKHEESGGRDQPTMDFWLLSDDGVLSLPQNEQVDVEAEMRKMRQVGGEVDNEDRLEELIYGWWKNGGWFGELDASGDFKPPVRDEDTTSVVSMSTTTDDSEWDTETESNDGRRTPTQMDPQGRGSSPSFTEQILDTSYLASLLDPKTPESREEAQALSYHLTSSAGVMTRSAYRRSVERQRAHLLTSTRFRPARFPNASSVSSPAGPLTGDDEAEILEHLILSRRSTAKGSKEHNTAENESGGPGSSWATGAEGMGATGPQCVVCQSSPRTILVWPCRCLSLCEDCRVSLAMNNFGNCVCCRRDVSGFSRLFVP